MTTSRYAGTRPKREALIKIPFPCNLAPQAANASLCVRLDQERKPASTAARLVRAPLLRMACRIRRSSMSMLVRMVLTTSV